MGVRKATVRTLALSLPETVEQETAVGAVAQDDGRVLVKLVESPFYATGPNLARQVKDQNSTLYENLAMVPQPLGKSNVAGKGLMSLSVKGDTKFPNASMALAQFFTNPRTDRAKDFLSKILTH